MADIRMTTQKQVRESFWANFPRYERKSGFTQNDYPADVRMLFCDFVEDLARDGDITESLAQRVTL